MRRATSELHEVLREWHLPPARRLAPLARRAGPARPCSRGACRRRDVLVHDRRRHFVARCCYVRFSRTGSADCRRVRERAGRSGDGAIEAVRATRSLGPIRCPAATLLALDDTRARRARPARLRCFALAAVDARLRSRRSVLRAGACSPASTPTARAPAPRHQPVSPQTSCASAAPQHFAPGFANGGGGVLQWWNRCTARARSRRRESEVLAALVERYNPSSTRWPLRRSLLVPPTQRQRGDSPQASHAVARHADQLAVRGTTAGSRWPTRRASIRALRCCPATSTERVPHDVRARGACSWRARSAPDFRSRSAEALGQRRARALTSRRLRRAT